jgi:hypothetical protein
VRSPSRPVQHDELATVAELVLDGVRPTFTEH